MRVLCDICGKVAVVKLNEKIDGWLTAYTSNGDRFKVCDECIDIFYDFFGTERPADIETDFVNPDDNESPENQDSETENLNDTQNEEENG